MNRNLSITPRATEKAYTEQTKHTYIFLVPRSASKQSIAESVAKEYKVTVESVRTLNRKGKPTRFSRGKRAYPGTTYRRDKKYAYVTVKEGDTIPVFEDENAADDKKAKKSLKTAEKTKNAVEDEKTTNKRDSASKKTRKSAKGDK